MKIYLVTRKSGSGYDEYRGHVVAAHSPQTARRLCPMGDECQGQNIWLDPSRTICTEVGEAADRITLPMVLLSDFTAG